MRSPRSFHRWVLRETQDSASTLRMKDTYVSGGHLLGQFPCRVVAPTADALYDHPVSVDQHPGAQSDEKPNYGSNSRHHRCSPTPVQQSRHRGCPCARGHDGRHWAMTHRDPIALWLWCLAVLVAHAVGPCSCPARGGPITAQKTVLFVPRAKPCMSTSSSCPQSPPGGLHAMTCPPSTPVASRSLDLRSGGSCQPGEEERPHPHGPSAFTNMVCVGHGHRRALARGGWPESRW